jgi:hypothetical protein
MFHRGAVVGAVQGGTWQPSVWAKGENLPVLARVVAAILLV